jgi:hypothetical protein
MTAEAHPDLAASPAIPRLHEWRRRAAALAVAAACLAPPLAAQQAAGIAPGEARGVVDERSRPSPPMRLFEAAKAAPAATLPAAATAAAEGLRDMRAWNAAGNRPRRNGFARDLPAPWDVALAATPRAGARRALAGGVATSDGDDLVWATQVRVTGAWRLRLHLARVRLPAGARLWVYGGEGNPVPFGPELIGPEGDLWTPSAGGGAITLEVRLPAATVAAAPSTAPYGFRLDRAMEIFDLTAAATPTVCLVDAACIDGSRFAPIDSVRRAIALLGHVVAGRFNAECTGALVNDTDDATTIPYLLTANHCYGSQADVASLEAFFDDFQASCNGPSPDLDRLPRTIGATLVATSKQSDFTLVRLPAFPDNHRFLLGWDARPLAGGMKLHQISHPLGAPQSYSEGTVVLSPPPAKTCGNEGGRPLNDLTKFVYVQPVYGGTLVVSSGAPLMTDGGLIVGQLSDGCGPNPENGCDYRNLCANGAFAATYQQVAPILNPTAGPQACVADDQTLCLNQGRFRVRTQWATGDGQTGNGQAVSLTDDTGYFWFFNSANVEMVVKVLNACNPFARYWFFAGGLTDVQAQINVTDMLTAAQRQYVNPQGTPFQPIQDTAAFATCP